MLGVACSNSLLICSGVNTGLASFDRGSFLTAFKFGILAITSLSAAQWNIALNALM
jgi:hypothetical protein